MQDDVEVIDGAGYFDDVNEDVEAVEPEANGDATPIGDVDSEAEAEVGDTDTASDDSDAAEGDGGTAEAVSDDGGADAEWIPGFEGRFRAGQEADALAAYQQLEKEFSGRKELERQFEERLERERQAAFEQARQLVEQAQPQRSVLQQLQERQQLQALSLTDPYGAFNAALQTGDQQAVQAVVQAVAQGNPELGIEGDPYIAAELMSAASGVQTQTREQELVSRLEQMEAQQAMTRAGDAFKSANAHLLEQQDVAQAFAAKVQANWGLLQNHNDAEAIKQLLDNSLDQALGQLAREKYSTAPQTEQATSGEPTVQTDARRPAKRRPHVEGAGSQRAPRQEKPTEEESIAGDILAAARELKPVY